MLSLTLSSFEGVAVVEWSARRLGDREVRGSNLGEGKTFFVDDSRIVDGCARAISRVRA